MALLVTVLLPHKSSAVPLEPPILLADEEDDDDDGCLVPACDEVDRGELCTGLLRFNEELNLGNGLANCMLGVWRVLLMLALLRC